MTQDLVFSPMPTFNSQMNHIYHLALLKNINSKQKDGKKSPVSNIPKSGRAKLVTPKQRPTN